MFIKKVTHRSRKNGKKYHTFKIVDSVRMEAGPRQKVLLNLGKQFDLPKEQWKDLCEMIEMKLSGSQQLSFVEYQPELEKLFERLMHKILEKRSTGSRQSNNTVTIVKDSLGVSNLRSIGGEHICYEMLK